MLDNIKKFLNEEQDPAAIEKVSEKLQTILMTGEMVDYIAVQKKPAVNFSPDCVALTNKRIIFCRPKNLGFSMDFNDYVWKDVIDCKLKEELLGAIFSVNTLKGSDIIDYLPKAQARRLYVMAQEQEEIQRELRRQLELEEKRAAAGNIQVSSQANTENINQRVEPDLVENISPEEEINHIASEIESIPITSVEEKKEDEIVLALQKLKTIYEAQLISREEYESKKSEVLSRI